MFPPLLVLSIYSSEYRAPLQQQKHPTESPFPFNYGDLVNLHLPVFENRIVFQLAHLVHVTCLAFSETKNYI